MGKHFILNDARDPVSVPLMEWARWFEVSDRRVALSEVGAYKVSTVFLGLDHQYGDGPPLLFETLVFGPQDEKDMTRVSTWAQAEEAHAAAVECCRLRATPAKQEPRHEG